jgi:DNA topoisomerase VI subunit A
VRIEQQAFAKHGLNFVLDTYLPEKIKKGKFLP